jgi:DNA-directed RNA polymerase subunit RPC12/RpoP
MSAQPYDSTLLQTPPLVPSDVIKDKGDRTKEQPEEFFVWMKKLCSRLRTENTQHNEALWAKHLTNEQMYRGNQFGTVVKDGSYKSFRRGKGDPRYTHNLIGGHVDAVVASHVLAKTDLEVLAFPTGDAREHTQGKARTAENIINYYEYEILTESFKIRESKLRQFGGGVVRYNIWDAKAGHQKVKRPKFQNKAYESPVADSYTCSNCGESGSLASIKEGYGELDDETLTKDADPECPHCGSNELAITKVDALEMPQATEYEEVPTGDCRTISIPMFQIDFDQTGTDFYEATWLKWSRRFRPEVIKEMFPFWKGLKGTGTDEGEDYGQKVGDMLRYSAGNTATNFGTKRSGKDESSTPSLVDVEQWWIRPCMPMHLSCRKR